MTSLEALKWRYATKKFDNEKYIAEHKINILKEAFNLTPTSYGLQPIKMLVIHNKSLQMQLQKVSYNQMQVSTCSHLLVFCIEKKVNKDFILKNFERIKEVRATPDEVLAPFREFLIDDFSKKEAEEIENWATKQAYLALGNILTVCAYEQIDACPMEGFEIEKYNEILQLKQQQLSSCLVLPIGYRAEDDQFADFKKVRRPLEEVVYNVN
ncbi:NAD(P)H-dependent oxidoreductase [Psychroflexus salis]|uniref:NAD(P)H-dependent oxidoreductase n=1 Tax=Psychroflexus salis TaxID=1526574 RepID=A0A916ZWC6_9FLAO|nr:NAD(P)H-dependent oxidoreductase [Psychroflexus salis]GGE14682.1 NAD(P)H-dependent oxidoreductase [Psychroflexus salis]